MAIISGVNIPDNKRLEVALTRVYGIGPVVAKEIIEKAGVLDNPRVKDLPEADLNRIREIIDSDLVVEGDLRRDVNQNIRRLIDIGCYRGIRHRKSLPVRGQRTKTNARAKRGRRMAISRKKE
ncbi:MAG: 30S ribosomal protein S13 [Chloroflexi bacterium]|nr:30S ribosomal protein S13 [Chloroflexota bacterium]|tara:strand:- start:149598 stop:149966 length:369 start_codon:yes stop_codon:yes gene_type:complete